MRTARRGLDGDDEALLALFRAIAVGDRALVTRRLAARPALATRGLDEGATRQDPEAYFLAALHHHLYAGDTALHVAAAAHQVEIAELLLGGGGDVRARNRRGAEPLHYAADGRPGMTEGERARQRHVIGCLVAAGADPEARDRSGVAPLHRAVRNRCSAAVATLIDLGANPRLRNRRGSSPMDLAVRNTGKSNSGSDAARVDQGRIIALLLAASGEARVGGRGRG